MTDFNQENPHQHVQVDLGNGWKLSLVQGYGTYSTHGSTVEIAVFDNEGKFRRLGRDWGDDVLGHVNATDLVKQIRKAQKLAKKGSD